MKFYKFFTAVFVLIAIFFVNGCLGGGDDEALTEFMTILIRKARDSEPLNDTNVKSYSSPSVQPRFSNQSANNGDDRSPKQLTSCPSNAVSVGFTDENGRATLDVPVDQPLSLCISKDGYIIEKYFDVTVAQGYPVDLGTVQMIGDEFSGSGQASGSVISAGSETPLYGVRVVFRAGINNYSGAADASTTTDGRGFFTADLNAGNYSIEFSLPGYDVVQTGAIVFGGERTVIETILLLETQMTGGRGEVEGTVFDALTGSVLSGTNIHLREGNNNFTGPVAISVTTNASGRYSLAAQAGYYTVEASRGGYNTAYFNTAVVYGRNVHYQNASLLQWLPENSEQITVVLTWSNKPADLDGAIAFEVYFGKTDPLSGSLLPDSDEFDQKIPGPPGVTKDKEPYIEIVREDHDAFGPETMVITRLDVAGFYMHGVYEYQMNSSSEWASESKAKVQVYQGNNLNFTFNVPPDLGSGSTWLTFEIEEGHIIPVNEAYAPPRNIR